MSQLLVWFLAFVVMLRIYFYFTGKSGMCSLCGTRNGDHDKHCPWR